MLELWINKVDVTISFVYPLEMEVNTMKIKLSDLYV